MRRPAGLAIGVAIALSILLVGSKSAIAVIAFVDANLDAGIDHVGPTYGSAWGDFNGDGRPDLWVGNHFTPPSLYVNQGGGGFQEIATQVWPGPVRDAHGAAWADVDRDGDQDLIEIVGGANPNHLWINESGTLVDQAAAWGVAFPGMRSRTPLWLDWNGDSILDLLLAYELGGGSFPTLLRGTGAAFVDASVEGGVAANTAAYVQLGDLTGDDEADLIFHGSYFPRSVYDMTTTPFVDVRGELDLDAHGDDFPPDSLVADLSGDGRSDLFFPKQGANYQLVIRNDQRVDAKMNSQGGSRTLTFVSDAPVQVLAHPEFTTTPADLIRIGGAGGSAAGFSVPLDPNDPSVVGIAPHTPGAGPHLFLGLDPSTDTWTIVYSGPAGRILNLVILADSPMADVTAVDWDADPNPSWPNYYESTESGFEERRFERGFGLGLPCNSVVGGDFDNDTDIDVFLACSRPVSNAPNTLFENQGDGTFVVVPNAGGAAGTGAGRSDSVTVVDYDEDGFLDLFVTNGEGGAPFYLGPHELFRNVGNGNHWIQVDLLGCTSNREGIGALVTVEAGGILQRRLQDGGTHRRSQNHSRLHFGLGVHTQVDRLEIHWPSGQVDVKTGVPADQIHRATEGGGSACTSDIPAVPGAAVLTMGALLGLTGCISIAWAYRRTAGT